MEPTQINLSDTPKHIGQRISVKTFISGPTRLEEYGSDSSTVGAISATARLGTITAPLFILAEPDQIKEYQKHINHVISNSIALNITGVITADGKLLTGIDARTLNADETSDLMASISHISFGETQSEWPQVNYEDLAASAASGETYYATGVIVHVSIAFQSVLLIRLVIENSGQSVTIKLFDPNDHQCILLTGETQQNIVDEIKRLHDECSTSESYCDIGAIVNMHIDTNLTVVGKVVSETYKPAGGTERTSFIFKVSNGHSIRLHKSTPSSTSHAAASSQASASSSLA